MEICQLEDDNLVTSDTFTTSHASAAGDDNAEGSWAASFEDMAVATVVYTVTDHSAGSREQMKIKAFVHVLDNKRFILLRMGGFNHPSWSESQKLGMRDQIKYLLRQQMRSTT